MAQLKDTLVSGNLSVTDTLHAGGMNAFAVGTCSTAAATAAKVVTIDDVGWQLQKGACIAVKFTSTNTAYSVTLNVNNSGAKSIWCSDVVLGGSNPNYCGTSGRYNYYVYDGTYWVWVGTGYIINDTVQQTATTTNSAYEVLFSGTADNTTRNEGARKTNTLTYNPSTKVLNINGKPALYGTYSASSAPSSPVTGQLWLKDAGMTIEEAKVLVVNTGKGLTSLPTTITNSNITSDMVVINKYDAVDPPSAQGSDLTVTTANGSVTISGTLNEEAGITLYLMRAR